MADDALFLDWGDGRWRVQPIQSAKGGKWRVALGHLSQAYLPMLHAEEAEWCLLNTDNYSHLPEEEYLSQCKRRWAAMNLELRLAVSQGAESVRAFTAIRV